MAVVFDSLWLDLAAFTAALLSMLYLYFKVTYMYWKKRGITFEEPSFPYGNIRDIFLFKRPTGEVYGDIYLNHPQEKLVGIFLVVQPAVVLRDPDVIKNFLVKDFGNFHDRGIHFNEDVDPLNAHLFFLNGNRWRNLRSKLSPTYTSGKMKMMFHTVLDCAAELQSFMEQPALLEEAVEVKDILARFTTDVIATCAFGIQCNCLKDPKAEFREYGRKFFNPNFINAIGGLINFMTPSLGTVLKIKTVAPDVNTFFNKIVRETIEYREKNGVTRNDFMQLLIRLKNTGSADLDTDVEPSDSGPGSHKVTMEEIAANAFVFFLAGFETSSTTMSFCLYELACNPHIQDKLRQEIDRVMDKNTNELTYDSIQDMKYLDMVISETLRKYPPVPILNRECSKRYRVPDTDMVMEPGVNVIVPVYALHHDPQYYPDPERFDPERFTEEAKAKRRHFTYLPFGEGPRICIGLRFGLMQTKVGLVSLLSKYQFKVCDSTRIPLVLDPASFILSSREGIFLQIARREER